MEIKSNGPGVTLEMDRILQGQSDMFKYTDIEEAPWYAVDTDNKKRARLNCMRHLLEIIPYQDLTPEPVELPSRQADIGYIRPPISSMNLVPDYYD